MGSYKGGAKHDKVNSVTIRIYIYILNCWQIPLEFEKQFLSFMTQNSVKLGA